MHVRLHGKFAACPITGSDRRLRPPFECHVGSADPVDQDSIGQEWGPLVLPALKIDILTASQDSPSLEKAVAKRWRRGALPLILASYPTFMLKFAYPRYRRHEGGLPRLGRRDAPLVDPLKLKPQQPNSPIITAPVLYTFITHPRLPTTPQTILWPRKHHHPAVRRQPSAPQRHPSRRVVRPRPSAPRDRRNNGAQGQQRQEIFCQGIIGPRLRRYGMGPVSRRAID